MITTIDAIKSIYPKLTSTDAVIESGIENVTLQIVDYLRTSFVSTYNQSIYLNTSERGYHGYSIYTNANVYAYGDMVFDATNKTITVDDDSFADFQVGDDIVIGNSIRNNGYFTITAKTDTELTVYEDLKTEDHNVVIYMVDFPKNVSNVAAWMVGYDLLYRSKNLGNKSENIGTYSHTMQDIGGVGYPSDIVSGLGKPYHRGK